MSRRSPSRPLVAAVLIAVVTVSFLFGPAPRPNEYRAAPLNYVPITHYGGFVYNWDSIGFVRLAHAPSTLLNRHEPRQSRPLFVLTAFALSRVVALVMTPPTRLTLFVPEYFGYVVLNFLALWLAMLAFQGLFPGARWALGVFLASSLLIVNDVVKMFFWTPHTQMFNVVVPVSLMALCRWVLVARAVEPKVSALLGLGGGLLLLLYGSYLLLFPVFVAAVVARRSGGVRGAVRVIVPFTIAFVTPTVAWIAIVTVVAGEFYSHEIGKFRQFVWIADAWRMGTLPARASLAAAAFLQATAGALWFPAALTGIAWLAARRAGVTAADVFGAHRPTIIAAAMAFASALPFFALLGGYTSRLSWSLAPPLFAVALAIASETRHRLDAPAGRVFDVATAAIVAGWFVYTLTKRGPWLW